MKSLKKIVGIIAVLVIIFCVAKALTAALEACISYPGTALFLILGTLVIIAGFLVPSLEAIQAMVDKEANGFLKLAEWPRPWKEAFWEMLSTRDGAKAFFERLAYETGRFILRKARHIANESAEIGRITGWIYAIGIMSFVVSFLIYLDGATTAFIVAITCGALIYLVYLQVTSLAKQDRWFTVFPKNGYFKAIQNGENIRRFLTNWDGMRYDPLLKEMVPGKAYRGFWYYFCGAAWLGPEQSCTLAKATLKVTKVVEDKDAEKNPNNTSDEQPPLMEVDVILEDQTEFPFKIFNKFLLKGMETKGHKDNESDEEENDETPKIETIGFTVFMGILQEFHLIKPMLMFEIPVRGQGFLEYAVTKSKQEANNYARSLTAEKVVEENIEEPLSKFRECLFSGKEHILKHCGLDLIAILRDNVGIEKNSGLGKLVTGETERLYEKKMLIIKTEGEKAAYDLMTEAYEKRFNKYTGKVLSHDGGADYLAAETFGGTTYVARGGGNGTNLAINGSNGEENRKKKVNKPSASKKNKNTEGDED